MGICSDLLSFIYMISHFVKCFKDEVHVFLWAQQDALGEIEGFCFMDAFGLWAMDFGVVYRFSLV